MTVPSVFSHLSKDRNEVDSHQFDEILGHSVVVLIHSMHHRVDERLLVAAAQLRHVAEVHVRDAAVVQREDVAWVGVAVEESELWESENESLMGSLLSASACSVDSGMTIGREQIAMSAHI